MKTHRAACPCRPWTPSKNTTSRSRPTAADWSARPARSALALARALIQIDPALRTTLKKPGLLRTRSRAKRNAKSPASPAPASVSSSPNANPALSVRSLEPKGESPQLPSVRTAVVGASGYSGQELLRYLARHRAFELVLLVAAKSTAGQTLSQDRPRPAEAIMAALTIVDAARGVILLRRRPTFSFWPCPHGTAAPYAVALREGGQDRWSI